MAVVFNVRGLAVKLRAGIFYRVWNSIVSVPDLCIFIYFTHFTFKINIFNLSSDQSLQFSESICSSVTPTKPVGSNHQLFLKNHNFDKLLGLSGRY